MAPDMSIVIQASDFLEFGIACLMVAGGLASVHVVVTGTKIICEALDNHAYQQYLNGEGDYSD